MYLFFDTETTGLPKNWKAPVSDLNNWPRMVQLAWLVYDEDQREIDRKDYIIRPEGFRIPFAAASVHRITTEKAIAEGLSLREVLGEFTKAVESAHYLIAHNIAFDEKIVGAEFLRMETENQLMQKPRLCTMESSINYCKLPGKYSRYKNPSLTQLHTRLFERRFEDAHDALADVVACADCFFELKKRGVITV